MDAVVDGLAMAEGEVTAGDEVTVAEKREGYTERNHAGAIAVAAVVATFGSLG